MFGLDWSEIAIIAVLTLLVMGPKEIPGVLRTVSKWMTKARSLAREFQSGVDEMIREAELDEARKSIEAAAKVDIAKEIEKAVDPTGDVTRSVQEIKSSTTPEAPGAPETTGTIEASTTAPATPEVETKPLPAPNGKLDEPVPASIVAQREPAPAKASEDA